MKYQGINPVDTLLPGEPFFFLRGKDILSTSTVMHYAEMLRDAGDAAGHQECAGIATAMAEWQARNPEHVKEPSTPPAQEDIQAAGVLLVDEAMTGVWLSRRLGQPEDDYVGQWQSAGGKVDQGESTQAAAIREAWEEARITLRECDLCQLYSSRHESPAGGYYTATQYVARVRRAPSRNEPKKSSAWKFFTWVNIPLDDLIPPVRMAVTEWHRYCTTALHAGATTSVQRFHEWRGSAARIRNIAELRDGPPMSNRQMSTDMLRRLDALVVLGLPVRVRLDGLRKMGELGNTLALAKCLEVLENKNPDPDKRYWPLLDLLKLHRALAEPCFPDAPVTVKDISPPEWLLRSPITDPASK